MLLRCDLGTSSISELTNTVQTRLEKRYTRHPQSPHLRQNLATNRNIARVTTWIPRENGEFLANLRPCFDPIR